MVDLRDVPVAHDHLRPVLQYRANQLGDIAAVVLVVGIGIYDDVGAKLEAGIEARLESGSQPLVAGQLDNVIDPAFLRHLDGPIGRAVVDDQRLDLVHTFDRGGQVGERHGEVFLLVQAGDLDHYLHKSVKIVT